MIERKSYWHVYYRHRNGSESLVGYDHFAIDWCKPKNFSNVIVLCMEYVSSVDTFMPKSELERLSEAEDRIIGAIENDNLIFVGKKSIKSIRNLIFYSCENKKDLEKYFSEKISKYEDVELSELYSDPDWNLYTNELYPNDYEYRLICDTMLYSIIENSGEDTSIPRNVDHWAFFNNRADGEKFSQAIQNDGYKNIVLEQRKDKKFVVTFSNICCPRADDLTCKYTGNLDALARSLGGEYDGWETGPAQKPSFFTRLFRNISGKQD